MFTEGISDIPEPYKSATLEVADMLTLIPPKRISVQERTAFNIIVRQKLPQLADLAVAELMISGHDLSRREFLLRLNEQRIQQIEAPFVVMQNMANIYLHRPKPFSQLRQAAILCAPTTTIERMTTVIERAGDSPMGRDDRDVIEEVLSVHPEMDKIVELFMERKGNITWYINWIEKIRQDAEKLRTNNEAIY